MTNIPQGSLVRNYLSLGEGEFLGREGKKTSKDQRMESVQLLFQLNQVRLRGLSKEDKKALKAKVELIRSKTISREKKLCCREIRKFFIRLFHWIRFGEMRTTSEWAGYLTSKLSLNKDPEVIFPKATTIAKGRGRFVMPVLEQGADGTGVGSSNCGLHAVKNSLLVLGAVHKGKVTDKEELFCSGALFRELFSGREGRKEGWKSAANLGEEGDVSIAQVWKIVEGVRAGTYAAPETTTVEAMKAIEKAQKGIPCFSTAVITFSPEGIHYGGGGADELRSLSALHQMRQAACAQKPFIHSFALGITEVDKRGALKNLGEGNDHWVSCTLLQSKERSRGWIGCNSDGDRYAPIEKSTRYLEKRLGESEEQFFSGMRKRYREAVGSHLGRRAAWLEKGLKQGGETALLNEQQENLAMIDAAYAFMKTVGWLKTPLVCRKEVSDLRKVAAFYGTLQGGDQYKKMAQLLENYEYST